LSPIVPHISHELWLALGHKTQVVYEPWPTVDESALEKSMLEIAVQVNGKLRGRLLVAANADNETVTRMALDEENVRRFVAEKTVRKTIVVPGRLVNIVV
jgi:leucyl-tRNA synthetase